ncbi:MAG TPA: MFS transporter [Spirochaetales bacterium]|nr:MFS transporter [Spirochaetales bacterium]HRY53802.1 MFS transporter [Spirochaetia bacterium]HRZ64641.1 MFS transporter [Spirochaetia bacterium]
MRNKTALLLVLIYAAFISLGIPDSCLGVAWPAMRRGWGLPVDAIAPVTVVATICSLLSGLAAARVLERLGTGLVVLLSCLLTGGAFLGYSLAPSIAWLYALALPLGFGAGSVDAGLNHFVAEHYSSRHMNWLHGFWGVGATIGPAIMASAVAGPGWASGYRAIAVLQLSLAAIFWASLPLWRREGAVPRRPPELEEARPAPGAAPPWAAWLGPVLYLLYLAVESGIGLWAASILVDARGLAQPRAGLLLSLFYGTIMAGRFLTGAIADRLGNRRMVRLGLGLALAGGCLFGAGAFLGDALWISAAGLALLGLGCAPVYPCLMHETPRRFDEATARRVVGRQVAFAYGGATLVPPAYGFLAIRVGLEAIAAAVVAATILLIGLSELLNSAT